MSTMNTCIYFRGHFKNIYIQGAHLDVLPLVNILKIYLSRKQLYGESSTTLFALFFQFIETQITLKRFLNM